MVTTGIRMLDVHIQGIDGYSTCIRCGHPAFRHPLARGGRCAEKSCGCAKYEPLPIENHFRYCMDKLTYNYYAPVLIATLATVHLTKPAPGELGWVSKDMLKRIVYQLSQRFEFRFNMKGGNGIGERIERMILLGVLSGDLEHLDADRNRVEIRVTERGQKEAQRLIRFLRRPSLTEEQLNWFMVPAGGTTRINNFHALRQLALHNNIVVQTISDTLKEAKVRRVARQEKEEAKK